MSLATEIRLKEVDDLNCMGRRSHVADQWNMELVVEDNESSPLHVASSSAARSMSALVG